MEHRSYMTNQGGGSKLVSFLIFILIFSSYSGIVSSDTSSIIESNNVEIISPEVVEILPHDSSAFTQGLLIFEGKIYESTGLYGESSIRVVNISTGVVENFFNLSEIYFAEGIALSDNHIIQLTWRENIGFIYNIEKSVSPWPAPGSGGIRFQY